MSEVKGLRGANVGHPHEYTFTSSSQRGFPVSKVQQQKLIAAPFRLAFRAHREENAALILLIVSTQSRPAHTR